MAWCFSKTGDLLCNDEVIIVGRNSSVGIVTRYGLDGWGIESRLWRDFPNPSRLTLWTTQPPTQWVPGFSLG